MTKLILTRGLPGCGKTTRAKAWVAEDPANRARVNRDDFRAMFHDSYWTGIHDCEAQVTAAQHSVVKALLDHGVSVVMDDTHLPQRSVRDSARLAVSTSAEVEIWDMTDIEPSLCIVRDQLRSDKNPVGEDVIQDKYERYVKGKSYPLPLPEETELVAGDIYVPNPLKPCAYIVDIDGTVALKGTRSPFDESRVHEDTVNEDVTEVISNLMMRFYQIIFCSGRTEGCREATEKWLCDVFGLGDDKPFLLMRDEGDMRKDAIVKRELFDKHIRDNWWVIGVFDDRQQVVDMWRDLGLTCFQVAPGNF